MNSTKFSVGTAFTYGGFTYWILFNRPVPPEFAMTDYKPTTLLLSIDGTAFWADIRHMWS